MPDRGRRIEGLGANIFGRCALGASTGYSSGRLADQTSASRLVNARCRGTTSCVMRTRIALVLAGMATVVGCRGNGKQAEPTTSGAEPAAPGPAAPPAPAAPVADTRPVAPPGTDKLVPVPAEVAAKVKLAPVVKGLARPVLVLVAPGDARKRLFVLEQHAGRVRIVENGKLLPKPFLEVRPVSRGNEQGLLGMAFHPQFATNGKLYVNYTGADDDTRIVEYHVSATNPDQVDPASRRELITIKQPFSNHNGGHLVFGPDGKLWTGMGDGGAAGDPHGNGQKPDALLGKMLRFDVDAAKPTPERMHLGVRNPWRFAFDAKTGDLFIGDVGQNLWENIYVVDGTDHAKKKCEPAPQEPTGAERQAPRSGERACAPQVHNFGWNVVEGNHCFEAKSCDRAGFTPPVVEYTHDVGCSVTGGVVYRGKALPMLDGAYFYADFCTNLVRSFRWSQGAVRDHWDWKQALDPGGDLAQISSFGVDGDGEVYVVSLLGAIYKLVPAS